MKRAFTVIAIAALAGLASGCASYWGEGLRNPEKASVASPGVQSSDLGSLVYRAAETLGDRAELLDKTKPIVVATVVSVDDLERSSTFGRLASQLIANRIQQRGFLVRDVTYMRALELRSDTGEMTLTREARKLSTQIRAQAVVAGTYAVAGHQIYLNIRLLNADSGEIISSADAVIPLNDNTDALFESRERAGFITLDQYEQNRSTHKQMSPEKKKSNPDHDRMRAAELEQMP